MTLQGLLQYLELFYVGEATIEMTTEGCKGRLDNSWETVKDATFLFNDIHIPKESESCRTQWVFAAYDSHMVSIHRYLPMLEQWKLSWRRVTPFGPITTDIKSSSIFSHNTFHRALCTILY